MRARSIAYHYTLGATGWRLADRLDLGSHASRRAHRYVAPPGAACGVVDAAFESEPPIARAVFGCSFDLGRSRFVLRRDDRVEALRVRRLLAAGHPNPAADLLLDGERVGTFPFVGANPHRQWQELDLDLPRVPRGLELRFEVVPRHLEGAVHGEYGYELWQQERRAR
jgi:hypothetical protein